MKQGERYREQILEVLSERQQTIYDLMQIFPLGKQGLYRYLSAMVEDGVIHGCLRRASGATRSARMLVYAVGPASQPIQDAADEVLAYIRVHRNRSVAQLAAALGLSQRQIQRQIKILRENGAMLYISGWEIGAHQVSAHYSVGQQPDLPKPKRPSMAEYSRRYRKRLKQDPDRQDMARTKRRTKTMLKRVTKAHPDPLMAALFGMRPATNDDRMAA